MAIGEPPVLIDEWQRVPAVWDAVRRLVDDDASGGRFLLTGSPPGPGTHSVAGRITTILMRPLAFSERFDLTPAVSTGRLLAGERALAATGSPFGLEDYVYEIIGGGFPGMRHLRGRALTQQLDGYLDLIVDRDLPEAGFTVRHPHTVRSWMRAYAAATATTASWETIRDAATSGIADKPARRTTAAYTDLLSALRVLDPFWQYADRGPVPGDQDYFNGTVAQLHLFAGTADSTPTPVGPLPAPVTPPLAALPPAPARPTPPTAPVPAPPTRPTVPPVPATTPRLPSSSSPLSPPATGATSASLLPSP